MPEPSWPRFSRLQQRVKWSRRTLDGLDDETLATLLRIAGESSRPLEEGAGIAVADGFPASSVGGGDVGGEVSRPTERAAVRFNRAQSDEDHPSQDTPDEWFVPFDAVQQACSELFAHLAEAEGVLNQVGRLRDYIINNGASLKGRVSSLQGDCLCCERPVAGTPNDRLRSGFCAACDMAWSRAGRPERPPFIATRRRQLVAEAAARNTHREQGAQHG